jgi:hypothetical protein
MVKEYTQYSIYLTETKKTSLLKKMDGFNWEFARVFLDEYRRRCGLRGLEEHMKWETTQEFFSKDKWYEMSKSFIGIKMRYLAKVRDIEKLPTLAAISKIGNEYKEQNLPEFEQIDSKVL